MKKMMVTVLLVFLVVTVQSIVAQEKPELASATFTGNLDEVSRLIRAGADVNVKFDFGASRDLTPLFTACVFSLFATPADKAEIIQLLIDAGANVNEKFNGMSILGQAINLKHSDTTIIKPLVAGGLDIDAKNSSGKTALHGAAFLGETVWVEPLIEHGADINAKDNYGQTPLDIARDNELADLIRKNGGISGKQ